MADGGGYTRKPRLNAGGSGEGDEIIARRNWARYEYGKQRGHHDYCLQAVENERMYLGRGLQWSDEDRSILEDEQGRKAVEFNEIADAINTALGNHIQNRVDIAYRPRGNGANVERAATLSKVAMQVCDNNDYRHTESQVAADGFIQQRGYIELSVDYNENLRGEIVITDLDPLDVIPDPDAKSYDPDHWKDVIVTRWMSLDDIELKYGMKARRRAQDALAALCDGEEDFGEGELDGVRRPKFGMEESLNPDWEDRGDDDTEYGPGDVMVRVVDRQHWKMQRARVALFPTGDIRIMEDATEQQLQHALAIGAMIFHKVVRRIRWTISTYGNALLHDDWSPFQHFTVIPFFPFFRRGQTRGLVDNAIGPQEMLNKAISQYLHIINTTANSGWIVEQNSLTNMDVDDLYDQGAQTGLVLEYAKGTTKPEKINPNTVPTGIDKLVSLGSQKIRTVTGISDALRGQAPAGQSGRAIQSLQFGSQLSLAVPLDNLARTRHLFGKRLLKLIQQFMDSPQVLQIVQRGADGQEKTDELMLNMPQEDGSVLNDLTIGEYGVVVTEQPNAITFENSQFEQAMAMRKEGIGIPDHVVLRYSTLAEKNEIAKEMRDAAQKANPEVEAKAVLARAQAQQAQAQAVVKGVEALFSALRASGLLRADPALAGIADMLVRSAGFIDQDAAPIYPANVAPGPTLPVPNGTNPMTPDNPQAGATSGIENGLPAPAGA